MTWYDDYMNYGQSPSQQLGAYGSNWATILAGLPQVPDNSIASVPGVYPTNPTVQTGGGGGYGGMPQGGGMPSYDYYNQGLAQLLAQMQGQYLSDAQYYAGLQLQREQMDKLADQWAKEFGWSKEQAIAAMLYQQQATTGYMQTNPYLLQGGAQLPGWASDIYQRIWSERPDLQTFYNQNWGQGQYDIGDAVRNWLQMTDDPAVQAAGRDPMAYAEAMGWYDPTQAGTYPAGSWQNTLERDIAEWTRQIQQEQVGLQYLGLLGQMRGPRDWLAYSRTVQGAGQTQLPAWAEAMMNRTALPSFGQWGAYAPEGYAAPGAAGPQAAGATGPYHSTAYNQAMAGMGGMLPHQIHPQQWAAMSPAMRDMLLGAVEEGGGYAPDFAHWMQQAWPTVGPMNPQTYWG